MKDIFKEIHDTLLVCEEKIEEYYDYLAANDHNPKDLLLTVRPLDEIHNRLDELMVLVALNIVKFRDSHPYKKTLNDIYEELGRLLGHLTLLALREDEEGNPIEDIYTEGLSMLPAFVLVKECREEVALILEFYSHPLR